MQASDSIQKPISQFTAVTRVSEGYLPVDRTFNLDFVVSVLFPKPLPHRNDLKGQFDAMIIRPDIAQIICTGAAVTHQTFRVEAFEHFSRAFDSLGKSLIVPIPIS